MMDAQSEFSQSRAGPDAKDALVKAVFGYASCSFLILILPLPI